MRFGWMVMSGVLFAQLGYVEEGEASYYAPTFHGRRTASGEKYDRHALTAAHRTLPFGTFVRVTHKESGKSVVVRINDRGPHKAGRVIDLSEKAARELGILARGVAEVRIEVTQVPSVESPPPPRTDFYAPDGKPLRPQPYGVQIGAFSEENNARTLARNAQSELRQTTFIWRAEARGAPLYRVVVGSHSTRKAAEKLRDQLKRDGWNAFVVHLPV